MKKIKDCGKLLPPCECHLNRYVVYDRCILEHSLSVARATTLWSVDLFREIIVAIGTSPGQINLFH